MEALASGERPKRTIVFTWFGSEESGGYGARYFIARPPVPLDSIVANLEFEMIGRADAAVAPHTLWLTGYERSNLGPELARRGEAGRIQRHCTPGRSMGRYKHGGCRLPCSACSLHIPYATLPASCSEAWPDRGEATGPRTGGVR